MRWARVAPALLAALATGAVVAVPRVDGSVPVETIAFGNTTCAPNWAPPEPGSDRFAIHNASDRSATVYLFNSRSGTITATIKDLAAGATRRLRVILVGGHDYAWSCDLKGYPIHDSEADPVPVPVHRQAGGSGPVVVPVRPGQLVAPLRRFRSYVATKITTLVAQVTALQGAIASGDLAAAQTAWLTAHETYLEIGEDDGAYGAFGNLGRELDGTAAGYVGATTNPRFTGFHRVELDLWGRGGLAAAGPAAATLARLVGRLERTSLVTAMPAGKLGVTNWTLRAHEILEDALRDTLSGEDDYGSNTALASVLADVSATREMLTLLAPLISPRAPNLLGNARRELTRIDDTIAATEQAADGIWIGIAQLPRAQREQLDSAVGAALETLSRVPDLLRIGVT